MKRRGARPERDDSTRAEEANGALAFRSHTTRGLDSSYARIYAAVRRIPRGRVATYGLIARVAGLPGHARQVGYALHALRDEADDDGEIGKGSSRARKTKRARDVPWQRVINSRGEISLRAERGSEQLQRALLEQEGVVFDAAGRVSLARFLWRPGGAAAPSAGSRRTTSKRTRVGPISRSSRASRRGG
jgi:methylated-DNA-protein-cysteine methyltransferase-like protein